MGAQSSKLEEVSDGLILSVAAREGHEGTPVLGQPRVDGA
jgi:hypothetical protein